MSVVSGWEGALKVATSEGGLVGATAEAQVQSVSPSHSGSLEEVYAIGSRSPQELKEGKIAIALKIDVNYVAGSAWPGRAGVGATGALTTYYVGVYPKGYSGALPKIVLQGKFGDYSLSMDMGILKESVSFKGVAMAFGTV